MAGGGVRAFLTDLKVRVAGEDNANAEDALDKLAEWGRSETPPPDQTRRLDRVTGEPASEQHDLVFGGVRSALPRVHYRRGRHLRFRAAQRRDHRHAQHQTRVVVLLRLTAHL